MDLPFGKRTPLSQSLSRTAAGGHFNTPPPPPPPSHIFPFCPIILCTSVSYYCDCIKGGAWGLILLWPCPVWEECVRAWMLVQQKNYRIGTWLSSALWPQQSTTVLCSIKTGRQNHNWYLHNWYLFIYSLLLFSWLRSVCLDFHLKSLQLFIALLSA